MQCFDRRRTIPRHYAIRIAVAAAVCAASLCAGCYSPTTPTARRWLDPFGWTSKPALSEQPQFQKQVNKDPFPTASQVGVATKTEKKTQK